MTVTPTQRAARGPVRRRLAAALVTAALLVPVVMLGLPGAASATTTPSPSPSASAPTGVIALTLSPLGNGVVRPGDALAVSTTVDNDTATALTGGALELSIGAAPIGDRGALTAWLDGVSMIEGMQPIGVGDVGSVAAQSASTTGIVVAATDPTIATRPPGVYPLSVSFVPTDAAEDGVVTARSVMIVPNDVATVNVGIIVPVTAGPLEAGLLTTVELTELTRPGGALANTLDAVYGTPAILAVDPAIPAAIRVLGSSAPTVAVAWLARLDALPNDRFALQFGDADVAVQLEAGRERLAQPTSLQYAMTPADFTPTPSKTNTPTPTPSSSVDPTAPVYPSLEDLLSIEGAEGTVFWPNTSGVTAPIAAALGTMGTEDATAYTVLPSTRIAAGSSGATVTARATVETSELLVVDAAISAALQTASLIDDSARRGAALTAATAHLSLATTDAAGAPLLVTLGRGDDRSLVALGSTLLAVTQAPGVATASFDDVLGAPARAGALTDTAIDPVPVAAASALFTGEDAIARFATVLDDPRLLTAPERNTILQLLGVSWAAEPADWTTAIADHQTATQATIDSVGLLTVPDVQQIGPSADIPVWVRNELPYPVNVVLNASSDDLRLRIQGSIDVVAGADSTTRVLIPVNAQIGSGEVDLALQLRSPSLVAIGDQQIIHVTVRADWERYGIIALAVIVGGLLVVGVIRTVRRRRRTRLDVDAAEADSSPDDPRGEAL